MPSHATICTPGVFLSTSRVISMTRVIDSELTKITWGACARRYRSNSNELRIAIQHPGYIDASEFGQQLLEPLAQIDIRTNDNAPQHFE